MVIKVFSLAEVLYLEYLFLILFDNTISRFVYIDDVLCKTKMNKKSSEK